MKVLSDVDLCYNNVSSVSSDLFADWYPTYTEVTQEGNSITVTFNLAPPLLGISNYFLQCYANGIKKYIDITPVSRAFPHFKLSNSKLQKIKIY